MSKPNEEQKKSTPSHSLTYDEFTKAHPTYGDVSGLRYGDAPEETVPPGAEKKGNVNE
ncbi:MAG TPA: hypothetical protein VGH16_11385 [Candidatus Binatia bacterium]|jgi:hypothetical protein